MGTNARLFLARRWFSSLIVVGVVLSIGASAFAAVVPWTNASGSNARFSWANGQSNDCGIPADPPKGMWGDPTVYDVGFFFNDMRPDFEASAGPAYPGGHPVVSSEMDVDIITIGDPFAEMYILEFGTYAGEISAVNASSASAEIFQMSPFVMTTIPLTMTFFEDNTWEARLDIDDLASYPGIYSTLGNFSLSITNSLHASPAEGESASIQKTGARVVFPEPTTLALVFVGIVPLTVRRLRRSSCR